MQFAPTFLFNDLWDRALQFIASALNPQHFQLPSKLICYYRSQKKGCHRLLSLIAKNMKHQTTPGGSRLRALREYYRRTQLEVELDASLGMGYLQRLELGRVQQPERDTLERILTALEARYTERREVLELFGYRVSSPIPDESEIQWAIEICQQELNSAVFPAYLLDCASRLLIWNALVPPLFQFKQSSAPAVQHYLSMLRLVFDEAYGFTASIMNTDVFFPAQIRALRYEVQAFRDETWCNRLIEDMLTCAQFKHYWDQNANLQTQFPARPLTPMIIRSQGSDSLQFRLISEPFVQDRRFRVIYCLPADPATIQQCLQWLENSPQSKNA